jgi:regulatory protein
MSPSPVPLPDEAALRAAALAHVARYATTRAGLLRVLHRRIDRAAAALADPDHTDSRAAAIAAARAAARRVADALVAKGIIDDAAFAERRAAAALRTGRSPAAARAALRAKGVAAGVADAATEASADAVFAAALILARKRRLGPFAPPGGDPDDPASIRRRLGTFARAGFSSATAREVLATDRATAEALIDAFRRACDL